jgi:hypothetical protein
VSWIPIPGALQLSVEIAEVVVSKALKPRTTCLHSYKHGVMTEPVRQHWRMAIGECKNGGKIGLKSARIEQNAISV